MKSYREMTKEELKNELSELKAQYRKFQEMDLALDIFPARTERTAGTTVC